MQEPPISDREREFHLMAFVDFVRWVASDPEAIRNFEAETGTHIQTGLSPLERMIDQATGHDRKMAEDFVKWCAEVYGLDFLPDDYLTQVMKPEEKPA